MPPIHDQCMYYPRRSSAVATAAAFPLVAATLAQKYHSNNINLWHTMVAATFQPNRPAFVRFRSADKSFSRETRVASVDMSSTGVEAV